MASETTSKQIAGRASINVMRTTKVALDSIKHPGQSYDGLIQELVRYWKENKEGAANQKRTQKSRGGRA